ncbi:NUDIX hydrolase [Pseudalkalibacillus caeni]|uniref:8-oxo-dGTP diphosphatase n=1 Tax=Exobacillus caeni TaxID=2574798 RepID=A0A5R9F8H9_9BACL|nr:8-oxo-dGTP diphosphatase [Pseudalkalibacillus caeni]TLS37153.1 8-oxo-dGTP diphosphatase [Pseudalkalibacillus caeni]
MFKFTICFIKQGNRILLLNRNKKPNMGLWNGVGGKIEPGETPDESIVREVKEETGLTIGRSKYKATVRWTVDEEDRNGMYVYIVDLSDCKTLETPLVIEEGILDWKDIEWIFDPNNMGIVSNIPSFLQDLLNGAEDMDYHCFYKNGKLEDVTSAQLV